MAGWDFRSGSGAKVVCEPNTCPEDGGGQPLSPSLPMIASYTWVTPCPGDELLLRLALENRGSHYCDSIRFGESLDQSGKPRSDVPCPEVPPTGPPATSAEPPPGRTSRRLRPRPAGIRVGDPSGTRRSPPVPVHVQQTIQSRRLVVQQSRARVRYSRIRQGIRGSGVDWNSSRMIRGDNSGSRKSTRHSRSPARRRRPLVSTNPIDRRPQGAYLAGWDYRAGLSFAVGR